MLGLQTPPIPLQGIYLSSTNAHVRNYVCSKRSLQMIRHAGLVGNGYINCSPSTQRGLSTIEKNKKSSGCTDVDRPLGHTEQATVY